MRVIIAGSRDITDPKCLEGLETWCNYDITEVVSGMAPGVDKLGIQWAALHNIPVKEFPADWATYKRGAGRRRNLAMAEYADALLAIWDGQSPGTAHMIQTMQDLHKPTFVVIRKSNL